MLYFILKFLHILGAVMLLGTGAGIAFFMLMAHRSNDPGHIFLTSKTVVLADFLFTATAVVAQPVTGLLLARELGLPLSQPWLIASFTLYVVAGALWLPVVWLQMRMRDLAASAVKSGKPLNDDYRRVFRLWFIFGFPGFGSVLVWWFRNSLHSICESFKRISEPNHTRIDSFLVSFDSEVRSGGCRRIKRTSESGH